MKRLLSAILCVATMALPLAARAGEVYDREQHQQQRIYQGVHNGTIGPREYRNLERREANLDRSRRYDLWKNDGRLAPQEARNLNRRENRLSHAIYRDKHNDDR
jgi:Ni/Co efflux regulator RcnB